MENIRESYDLLDIKGVDRKVQHLFSEVLFEDEIGRLYVNYYDIKGEVVDRELLSVTRLTASSGGISGFSTVAPHLVRVLFISDSITNLIFHLKGYLRYYDIAHSAFIATGSRLDRSQFVEIIQQYHAVKQYYSVYGNSLLGKIKDCKVQHWINGEDCLFRIEENFVYSEFRKQVFKMESKEFTLRDHLRQVAVRQTLKTKKPKNKKIENFFFYYEGA